MVSTIAHETAHMWFGDLVTMRWWEGIWLNEAFATFMELLVTDDFEPRWQVWTNFGADRAAALATDSLRSSRAIEYPVGRPEEADDMFDVITYDKGGSVLRMIERYLGDDTFRRGLNLYLDKHRFANTTRPTSGTRSKSPPGQPVRAAMGTWVNQAGHPIVLGRLPGPASSRCRSTASCSTVAPRATQRWVVPVSLRYATAEGGIEREQLLLHDGSTTVRLEGEPGQAVNEEAWGVYRCIIADGVNRRLRLLEAASSAGKGSAWFRTLGPGPSPDWSRPEFARFVVGAGDRYPDVWWAISPTASACWPCFAPKLTGRC